MRRILASACLVVALLAAPVAAQEKVRVSERAETALTQAEPLVVEAEEQFAAKHWDASIAAYDGAIAALGDESVLAGRRDQVLYNEACAHARAGRAAKAAEVFALSVKSGLRPVVGRVASGAWIEAPGLSLEHIIVDPDLDSIRAEKAYLDALKPYLAAGAPLIEFTRPDTDSLVPAVIVLAADGEDAERALPAWRVAARGRRVALVAVAGPIRPTAKDRRWILGDGDDRWAVAKVKETLDLIAKEPRIDPKRVFLVGVGERPGEAAWAAALADPSRLAGVAAPDARFHAAWHADALAKAPATWRVALAAADVDAAKLLKERGIEAATIAPSKDESVAAAAILSAMLDKR